MKSTFSRQRVVRFTASSWNGPFFQPLYGAVHDEREPRPPQRLAIEAFEPGGIWVATLAGSATYENDGVRHRLVPGTILSFVRPDPGVIVHPPAGERWHHVWLAVTGEMAMKVLQQVIRRHGRVHQLPPGGEPVRLARELLRLADRQSLRDPWFWSVRTHAWLSAWWREASLHAPSLREALTAKEPSRMISLSVGGLKRMAGELGYSRSYLSRRLKRAWDGYSPAFVLRLQRLNEAARLMRETDLSVAEVGTQVGYARPSSFVVAFKKHFGTPPLRYRHDNAG